MLENPKWTQTSSLSVKGLSVNYKHKIKKVLYGTPYIQLYIHEFLFLKFNTLMQKPRLKLEYKIHFLNFSVCQRVHQIRDKWVFLF